MTDVVMNKKAYHLNWWKGRKYIDDAECRTTHRNTVSCVRVCFLFLGSSQNCMAPMHHYYWSPICASRIFYPVLKFSWGWWASHWNHKKNRTEFRFIFFKKNLNGFLINYFWSIKWMISMDGMVLKFVMLIVDSVGAMRDARSIISLYKYKKNNV